MTQQEYEQQRRECFVKFCKDNGIDHKVNIGIFDAFDQIFDRAYALGKQKETITQEEVEKVAEESADNVINGYRIDDILRDDLRDDMINLFKDAIAALGKREKGG